MIARKRCLSGVVGSTVRIYGCAEKLQSPTLAELTLESAATAGESPLSENVRIFSGRLPSKAGHVIARLNSGGPSPKAKYYLATDSERVARAKSEKNPC